MQPVIPPATSSAQTKMRVQAAFLLTAKGRDPR
jgi:hypothetical protein